MQSYNLLAARCQDLGSSLFARHYLGNHYYFLFLRVLRCFSSPGWLSLEWYIFNIPGCPIRKSKDITLVCSSPRLIAAYHVLHRLSDPRHPPCALNCFKKFIGIALAWGVYHYYCIDFIFPICQRSVLDCIENCGCVGLEPNDLPEQITSCLKELFRVEDIGVEPMTLCVQGRCSSQLS